MQFPTITAAYGAILALVFAALSMWVIGGRLSLRVIHGDGGESRLAKRIRAHANFAEYLPLILLLVGWLESSGAPRGAINALLATLVATRIAHPFGMVAPLGSLPQYALRGAPAALTLGILIVAAAWLFVRVTL